MLSYSAYSTQVQNKVDYGSQSRVSLTLEYLWDVFNQIQLRPFVDVAVVQRPSETFTLNDQRSRFEYTAGTQVTLGAQLSAAF
jgi:outer membrane autotransporter protein